MTCPVRLWCLIQDFLLTFDSGDDIDFVVWSLIELLCIVVCGSLPALRPYFRSIVPKLTATWRRSTQSMKRTRTSTTRRSANTPDSSQDQKEQIIYDALQLRPLSSVKAGVEWSQIPDEPRVPPRAANRHPSSGQSHHEVPRLTDYIRVTRSFSVRESRNDHI